MYRGLWTSKLWSGTLYTIYKKHTNYVSFNELVKAETSSSAASQTLNLYAIYVAVSHFNSCLSISFTPLSLVVGGLKGFLIISHLNVIFPPSLCGVSTGLVPFLTGLFVITGLFSWQYYTHLISQPHLIWSWSKCQPAVSSSCSFPFTVCYLISSSHRM